LRLACKRSLAEEANIEAVVKEYPSLERPERLA
jgi:hypothetical protein